MILSWIRRRGSGLARRAAAHFRRSVAEARTAGTRAAPCPPLRLGGTTNESSEPLLRRVGRRERRTRDSTSSLLAAGRRRDGSDALRTRPPRARDADAYALWSRRDVLRP